MSPGAYYSSEHLDDSVAFWLIAYLKQLDSHAIWSAKAFTRRDDEEGETSRWLFRDYLCSSVVLHEFVKRGLVIHIEKQDPNNIHEGPWKELQETLKACKPIHTIRLNQAAEEYDMKYREPDRSKWFEIVISSFSEDIVRFSLSLKGYKYKLCDIELDQQSYYIFADRLDAQIRFLNRWFPLEILSRQLQEQIEQDSLLTSIETDLVHEMSLLRRPTNVQIAASCRSLFPLLERALRDYASRQGWSGNSGNLDQLINQFDSARALSKETITFLRMVAKPYRDYILHGSELPIPVAKVVLAVLLDVFSSLGSELKPKQINRNRAGSPDK